MLLHEVKMMKATFFPCLFGRGCFVIMKGNLFLVNGLLQDAKRPSSNPPRSSLSFSVSDIAPDCCIEFLQTVLVLRKAIWPENTKQFLVMRE